jgi:hypothetical protein
MFPLEMGSPTRFNGFKPSLPLTQSTRKQLSLADEADSGTAHATPGAAGFKSFSWSRFYDFLHKIMCV